MLVQLGSSGSDLDFGLIRHSRQGGGSLPRGNTVRKKPKAFYGIFRVGINVCVIFPENIYSYLSFKKIPIKIGEIFFVDQFGRSWGNCSKRGVVVFSQCTRDFSSWKLFGRIYVKQYNKMTYFFSKIQQSSGFGSWELRPGALES